MEALPILTCEPLNVTTSVRGEWSWHVNSIVACCHSAKLCGYAARDFRSQHYNEWPDLIVSTWKAGSCFGKHRHLCQLFAVIVTVLLHVTYCLRYRQSWNARARTFVVREVGSWPEPRPHDLCVLVEQVTRLCRRLDVVWFSHCHESACEVRIVWCFWRMAACSIILYLFKLNACSFWHNVKNGCLSARISSTDVSWRSRSGKIPRYTLNKGKIL